MSGQTVIKPRSAKRVAARPQPEMDAGCGLVRTNAESATGEILTPDQSHIFNLSPQALSVHPDVVEVAPLQFQEIEQLRQAITEAGRVIQPLVVNSARQILDGRHRCAIADELGLETVPCVVDDRADALDVAISSALDRRHLSQGQRALFVFKLHRITRVERAASGPDNKISSSGGAISLVGSLEHYELPSFRKLSSRYGIDDHLFAWINTLWNNSTTEEWGEIVRLIESGEQKLKSIYHGFGGRVKTKGKMRPPERLDKQETRFLVAVKTYAKKWDHLELQDRTEFVLKLVSTVVGASPDMAVVLEKAFEQARLSQKQK